MKTHRILLLAALALGGVGACAPTEITRPVTAQKDVVISAPTSIQTAHPYRNASTQSWDIVAPAEALNVTVTFDRFETEPGYDFLSILDGNGTVVHRLSGTLTGQSYQVTGSTMRLVFVADYSVRAWGFQVSEYRYETADPGHPTDHRPYCGAIGSRSEGWYWGDTGALIKYELCAAMPEPTCNFIGSRSEGWYSSGLIAWDFCHLTVKLALAGEPCGTTTENHCYGDTFCRDTDRDGDGTCEPFGWCADASDCSLPENAWTHDGCVGQATCDTGMSQCQWTCGAPEEGPWSWTTVYLRDVASAHPYANSFDKVWDVLVGAGATQIKIHFTKIDTESGYDFVDVNVGGQTVSFDGLREDFWTSPLPGTSATVRLRTDGSVTRWGFQADRVSYYEQLEPGVCNIDEDCGAGKRCEPNRCFSIYGPCHGRCVDVTPGQTGETCDVARPCAEGLACKNVTDGVGSCQDERWCAPVTVDADCAALPHIAIPGSWSCSESTCVWHGSMPPRVFTNETAVAIPDNDAVGITSTLEVADTGNCQKAISVSANLTHTYIGDLVVGITDPNGVRIVLHDRAGGSTDNLSIGNLELSNLVGVATANGTWTLDVHDRAAADTGTLQNWSLSIGCR